MKPARIKLITTEMVIAWGMICLGFAIYDSIFHNLNIIVFHSSSFYSNPGKIASTTISFSILPALYLSYCIIARPLAWLHINHTIVAIADYSVFVILQVSLYWYAGNLLGRIFAWLYTKRFPSEEEQPPMDGEE